MIGLDTSLLFTDIEIIKENTYMKKFMDKDFLLKTDEAKHLYHDFAAQVPVLDYHCHINPQEIYEDRKFNNITEVWLGLSLIHI